MDKHLVRGSDGSVDVAASANAYAKALTEWCAKNELPSEDIADAVNAVLDSRTGTIPMPALLGMATQSMGATPANFKVLSDRIHAYVTGQSKAGLLFISKGKGGGVSREKPAKKSA